MRVFRLIGIARGVAEGDAAFRVLQPATELPGAWADARLDLISSATGWLSTGGLDVVRFATTFRTAQPAPDKRQRRSAFRVLAHLAF